MAGQFVRPVKLIWAGYKEISAMPRSSRGGPLRELLATRFRITSWEWQKLKELLDASERGDEVATSLIADIDSGRLTLSAAHGRLQRHQESQSIDPRRRLPLRDVHVEVLRTVGFAERLMTDLRNGVALNTAGVSTADGRAVVQQLRQTARCTKLAADYLENALNGEPHHNGVTKQRSRPPK